MWPQALSGSCRRGSKIRGVLLPASESRELAHPLPPSIRAHSRSLCVSRLYIANENRPHSSILIRLFRKGLFQYGKCKPYRQQ